MKSVVVAMCLCMTLLAGCKGGGGGDSDGSDEQTPTTEVPTPPTVPENTATKVCDFRIQDIPAGGSRTFDCVLDLGGESVDVAAGATLSFDNGDISNGTLNFTPGKIDGSLLSANLEITGDVDLISEEFDFFASRWGIREGQVSDAHALLNRDALNRAIAQVHKMGGKVFRINVMDAYFNVTPVPDDGTFKPEEQSIQIPSVFTLQMTANTHMRVQPNSHRSYALLSSVNTNSVAIRGGNLYGDRFTHDYASGSTHEWGYLVFYYGVHNGGVYDATLRNATGDGIKVSNTVGGRNMSYFVASQNTFDGNRRNHISVTHCESITISENTFRNASTGGSGASAGVGPGVAVDLNASRTRDANGVFIEKVKTARIRRNTETNSRGGSIAVTHAEDVEITDNTLESGISYTWASETIIRNNQIAGNNNPGVALQLGQTFAADATVFGNRVGSNRISGFATGMHVAGHNVVIGGNTIEGAINGMILDDLENADIFTTTIRSDRAQSRGIVATDVTLRTVTLDGNTIEVSAAPLALDTVNTEETINDFQITTTGFQSESDSVVDNVAGLTLDGNQHSSGLVLRGSQRIEVTNAIIRTATQDGIHVQQTNTDITISGTRINVPSDRVCIRIDAATNAAQVTQSGNVCQQETLYDDPGVPISTVPYASIPNTSYTIDLVQWDIPSDGTNPVKTNQNLQQAVDWAKAQGFGIVRFPAGHFMIGEYGNEIYYSGLKLYGDTAYLFDPNTILEMTSNDKWNSCLLEVRNVQNVLITGGQLRGDRDTHIFTPRSDGATAHDEGHLICLEGKDTANVTIHSTIMRNASGDGVLIVGGTTPDPSVDNVDIINNDIGYNRRQGISLVGATNVRIEDNEIHHINGTAPQFGIDFEGPNRLNENAVIRNNYFHHNRGGDIVNTDGRNVLIENNVLEQGEGSSYVDGPLVYWKKGDMTVRYNEITMTSMSVNNWNGIIMYSNTLPKTNPATTYIYENICNGCGMYMYYGADLVIRDNTLFNGHIALKDFTNVTVNNNKVIGSRAHCWPYRFLRVRGSASGNTLDGNAVDIPLRTDSDYSDCWL